MKYFVFIMGLLLIAICAHASAGASIVNIDGTWSGVYDSKGKDDQPPKNFIFKFKSDNDSLTGTACDATAKPDEWVELKNIELKGKKIYFTAEPVPGMNIKCEGEIEGDEIELTFSYIQKPIFYSASGMLRMQNKQGRKEKVFTDSFTLKREK